MNIPLIRPTARPTPGVTGEVRFNSDTNEMQLFDGKVWLPLVDSPQKRVWKKWRAWYPVRVNKKWNWGNIVYRRRVLSGQWQYGDMFDVLREV